MRRLVWTLYGMMQVAGCLCLLGGEAFAITRIGYECRIFAFWVLEPGFVAMESLVEDLLFHSRLTVTEQYWLGVVLAVAFNLMIFALVLRLLGFIKKRRTSNLRKYNDANTFD